MLQIRPISDLRNKFTEISKAAHEKQEPIILTRNGYGDMVVMSYECFAGFQGQQSPDSSPEGVAAAASASIPPAEQASHPSAPARKTANTKKGAMPSAPQSAEPTPSQRGSQEIVIGFTD